MQRIMLKSKIHRATITDLKLDYEGSAEIDTDLLRAADILPFEQIQIYNVNNGNRFTTYAIEGAAGSGIVSLNGAAARQANKRDIIIIAAFANLDKEELKNHKPSVVYVDKNNRKK